MSQCWHSLENWTRTELIYNTYYLLQGDSLEWLLFVFQDKVSLCNSSSICFVDQAGLELTEICLPLPPRVLGWKARPHHHTQPGWERSGCPGPLVSEDGFVCVVNLYDESLCPMLKWHESEASSKRVWHPPLYDQASSESTWLRSLNKA